MKKTIKQLLFLSLLVAIFVSCKKDENKVYYEGGTAPLLSASSTNALVLTRASAALNALSFSWTNPNYQFTTGLNSQDVFYSIQIDTTGSNFKSTNIQEIGITASNSIQFTVQALNAALGRLELLEDVPHNVEFRIKSNLINGTATLYSNVIKIVITPYLDVAVPVPTNGDLWITGDAVTSGWSNPLGNPFVVSQKFTRVSNILYELTITMPGGGAYKLLQDNGNWATQYHMTVGTWASGEFEKRDSDPAFPGPPGAGTYKISVNFKTGLFKVTR